KTVRDVGDLCGSRERPLWIVLVRRLMVTLRDILVCVCLAPPRRLADEVHTGCDGCRRNSNTREREVIGAVEITGFRMLVRRDANALGLEHRRERRAQRALVVAHYGDV